MFGLNHHTCCFIKVRSFMFTKPFSEWFRPSGGFRSSQHFFLLVLRGFFFALVIGIGTGFLSYFLSDNQITLGIITFVLTLLAGGVVILVDVLVKNKQITTISAIYFGLLMGFLLGTLFWMAIEPLISQYATAEQRNFIQLLITLVSCYIAVSTLLQTKDEFRFIIPYVEFSKQLRGARPMVLDTSVIIDGRIADICETGFVDTKLIVPRFVLQELQGIADSSDKIKRNRGRRGLDVLKRLQNNDNIDLQMHEANIAELRDIQKVDERLVVLSKVLGARVVTNDFNLNKIAQLQGVEVINLNELANSLKLVALPGETLLVKVVKQGDQIGQGVGYLDDGTMVVVEQGKSAIGQEVNITVTSVLQTPAGRMIFGRMESRQQTPQTSSSIQAAGERHH